MKLDYMKIIICAANRKMSIKDLVNKAQITTFTLLRIKKGLKVRVMSAGKLAAALGVDVEEILAR